MWAIWINKPRWLGDIYFFGESALEERIVDVKLFDRPSSGDRKLQDQTNCNRLDDRTKCLGIVHSVLLCVTTSNPARLIPVNRTISKIFDSMDPPRTNNMLRWQRRNQFKSMVSNLSIILSTHRTSPILISHGLAQGSGNLRSVCLS